MVAKYCCLGFIGLRLNTTKEEMLRALLESIGFSMMKLVDVYMSETGNHLDQVAVDGGVSRNDFIVQMMADLTGMAPTKTSLSSSICFFQVSASSDLGMWRCLPGVSLVWQAWVLGCGRTGSSWAG